MVLNPSSDTNLLCDLNFTKFGLLLYKIGHMLVVGIEWGNESENMV